jgi:hypothetical protein
MKRHSGRKGLSREQKIWLSIAATLLGLTALSAAAVLIGARRNTDLADPASGVTAEFMHAATSDAPPIRFTEVASELGIRMRHGPGPRTRTLPEDTGSGIAWGDYDGDGDWDLYVVNMPGPPESSESAANRLYRNDGARFVDVTEAAGVADAERCGMGASFADYDGDGDVDLYVTNRGPNRLFRNRGDGTFEDVAENAGVADPLWSTGVAWGDFDRDGLLDLYVCNYVRYDADAFGEDLKLDGGDSFTVPFTLNPNSFDPEPNRLYRNRGDGSFEEVAEPYGVQNPEGRSLAATFVDLDGDGWLDLYVNNDVSTNCLYRNMHGERDAEGVAITRFADLSTITGTADPRGSMGLSVGEIGAMTGAFDGLPDLFITHWVAQENAFYQSVSIAGAGLEYRDKIRHLRIGEISIGVVGWGCALVDLDRDGRVDIAVANGSTLEQKTDNTLLIPEPMFLFWNAGAHFVDVAPRAGPACARRHSARGLAAADFDGDGDVDLALAINRGEPLLLRNESATDNRSLTVILEAPSAATFGAKVEVVIDGRPQVRWWGADVSYLSGHAAELVFGLGPSAHADEVRVRWADGRETTIGRTPAGRLVVRPLPTGGLRASK